MPVCPNCKHKHNFWDVEIMERTHMFTEKFIEITGCHHKGEDGNGFPVIRITHMYGCPKCHVVFWDENW